MRRHLVTGAAVAIGAAIAYNLVLRPWHLRWGATTEEFDGNLPGDDLLVDADLTATRAITIPVPADHVWAWIAQLGQGRGGFYSYDRLENLLGCDIHSADHVELDWQQVRVGDKIKLAPEVSLTVVVMERGDSLVLRGGIPVRNGVAPYDFTWAFVVHDKFNGTTRLLVRERYQYLRWWAALMVEPTELISFVMTHKMLRGIRDRAVSASQAGDNMTLPQDSSQ